MKIDLSFVTMYTLYSNLIKIYNNGDSILHFIAPFNFKFIFPIFRFVYLQLNNKFAFNVLKLWLFSA